MGSPTSLLKAIFTQVLKTGYSLYSWQSTGLTVWIKTTTACLLHKVHPRVKPIKLKENTLLLDAGGATELQTYEQIMKKLYYIILNYYINGLYYIITNVYKSGDSIKSDIFLK